MREVAAGRNRSGRWREVDCCLHGDVGRCGLERAGGGPCEAKVNRVDVLGRRTGETLTGHDLCLSAGGARRGRRRRCCRRRAANALRQVLRVRMPLPIYRGALRALDLNPLDMDMTKGALRFHPVRRGQRINMASR